MDISNKYRDMIVSEIKFVIEKMDQSPEVAEKLYYFSAIFGIIQRVFNIEFDPNLVHAHLILRSTHDAFSQRLKAIQQGGDKSIKLCEEQFNKLSAISIELAEKIKKKENIDNTLKKFAILAYSTTGNGYYLIQKGLLKI